MALIIPALNEEKAIGHVLRDIPSGICETIIVVDNGSTDATAHVASDAGAIVLHEPQRGYGRACVKGIRYLQQTVNPDVLVFLDGDHSDHPDQLPELLEPIRSGKAELVIGSRLTGERERGSMTLPQVFGNKLAVYLIRMLTGVRFTDLGPFRAIRFDRLLEMEMTEMAYGWTVEMQLKAANMRLPFAEVPV
ncbi:MAG: glycosyltransferase family 2 protein, partial [Bacteroidota bacterium]